MNKSLTARIREEGDGRNDLCFFFFLCFFLLDDLCFISCLWFDRKFDFPQKKMVGKLILKSNNWKSSFLAVTSVEDGIVYGAQPIIQKL